MYNLIEYIKNKGANIIGTSTVKLNVNAQEFVPPFKKDEPTTKGADFDVKTVNTEVEALDKHKPKCNLILPWKGFPKKTEKPFISTQIVLLNDVDYMIVPRTKKIRKYKEEILFEGEEKAPVTRDGKPPKENVAVTSANAPSLAAKRFDSEEKRRQKERKVAVEALKLVEQRRMRGALLPTQAQNQENAETPKPIIHLSRSPIRYTPEERIKVDRLRVAKKEKIERVLKEMRAEKMEQEKQKKAQMMEIPVTAGAAKENQPVAVPAAPRRYIPTTKEWDEQCRARHLANYNSRAPNVKPTEAVKREDLRTSDIPRYRPPSQPIMGERRNGNLTHSLHIPNCIPRRIPPSVLPLVNRQGKIVQRYSIAQLLVLEPQPEVLEKLDLAEELRRLDIGNN